jgi:type I restriction enzyme M protein
VTASDGLSVKNPYGGEDVVYGRPQTIMDGIATLDAESAEMLVRFAALLNKG